jgi:hypothetical protein
VLHRLWDFKDCSIDIEFMSLRAFIAFLALITLAACGSQDEKATTPQSPASSKERSTDYWLTENQAYRALASSNSGDGVWGMMYDNPATNFEVLAIRTVDGWLVCSRETGGQWSKGTPFLSVDSALHAMGTGAGIKRFRTWRNGRVSDLISWRRRIFPAGPRIALLEEH